ncbi:MAG: radical SAM protein, partial [Alphaproteobacteria bacterium]|nr:radical SAM protein [Alphaproteobacteria bacterium]
NRKLASLYFGGGTPSLAPLGVIDAVIRACERLWGFAPEPEITIEANPTDAEQLHFEALANAGVNRLSLGVQSLRDDALAFLGRDHDAAGARRAIETARRIFNRTTFDLIYARPGQTLDAWREELSEALDFGAGHLSLYQLTIEPGTAFAKAVNAGRWAPANEDQCADQFDLAQEMTAAAGLPAYEISNHASPAEHSRHNLIYWNYHDYIGVGPGAHGRLSIDGRRLATEAAKAPADYLAGGADGYAIEQLDAAAQLVERLTMGLRLTDGITLYADDYFYADEARTKRLHALIADDLVTLDCGRLRATANGRRVLNAVLFELLR